jgi:hypothetical protein
MIFIRYLIITLWSLRTVSWTLAHECDKYFSSLGGTQLQTNKLMLQNYKPVKSYGYVTESLDSRFINLIEVHCAAVSWSATVNPFTRL